MRFSRLLIGLLCGLFCTTALPLQSLQAAAPAILYQDLQLATGTALQPGFSGGEYFDIDSGCGTPASCIFLGLVEFLANRVLLLIAAIAVAVVVRAGLALIASQDEGKLQKAKRQIGSAVVAVVLAFISQRFLAAFYAPGGILNPEPMILIVNDEGLGILSWVLAIIPIVAVFMILVSGIKAVGSFGKEDGVADMRKTVFGIVMGLILIISTEVIVMTLGVNNPFDGLGSSIGFGNAYIDNGAPDTSPLINRAFALAQGLLAFLALAAVGVIVYGAVVLILRWGSEDQLSSTRQLIGRVLIGLTVVFFAYVMLQFVLSFLPT